MLLKSIKILIFVLIICYVNEVPGMGIASSEPTGLAFWTVGNAEGIYKRFGKNTSQMLNELYKEKTELDCFLLALAEQPLTEREILEKCAIPSIRLHHFITTLKSINLIKKTGQDNWATTIPVVTDKQMRRIRESLIPLAQTVAQYLKSEIPKIKTAYEEGKSETDPAWEEVAHLVIDKFIVDGTFHSNIGIIERERGFKQYYSHDQQHIPAFFLEKGPNFSTFGTNWYPFKQNNKAREVYILHGALFYRTTIPFNHYRNNRDFSKILHRVTPDGRLQALTKSEKKILKELDWTKNDHLLVPIIQAKSVKTFMPVIEKIGRGAAEVLFKNHSIIINSFQKSPYAKFMDGGGDYIQVCYHILFSEIIKQLIKSGILPVIPESVPEHFGVFITIGSVFE
jgi:hypothetical protein